jgi:hypothetical protein
MKSNIRISCLDIEKFMLLNSLTKLESSFALLLLYPFFKLIELIGDEHRCDWLRTRMKFGQVRKTLLRAGG